MNINNKRKMARWLESGALGPTLRSWRSVADIPPGVDPIGIRYLRTACERSFCDVRVPRTYLQARVNSRILEGFDPARFVFWEQTHFGAQLINAELSAVDGIPTLFYSLDPGLAMRPALAKSGRHRRGPGVWLFLQQLLPQETVGTLREMYDAWCDVHTIEFAGYDCAVTPGCCHAIVWELRAY